MVLNLNDFRNSLHSAFVYYISGSIYKIYPTRVIKENDAGMKQISVIFKTKPKTSWWKTWLGKD